MKLHRSNAFPACTLAFSLIFTSSLAWADATLIAADKVVAAIRSAKIMKADAPLAADIKGGDVQIVTERSTVAKDNDCKIDSMLMAKTLMQAFPGQVTRLKVEFGHPGNDDVDEVTVTSGLVKAYGAGAMSENELLTTVNLTTKHVGSEAAEASTESTHLKDGPAKEIRMLNAGYIEELRRMGTDVKPFEAIQQKIEDSIGTTPKIPAQEIRQDASDLRRRLLEQEQLVKEARGIQRERPMTGGGFPGKNFQPQRTANLKNQHKMIGKDLMVLISTAIKDRTDPTADEIRQKMKDLVLANHQNDTQRAHADYTQLLDIAQQLKLNTTAAH